MDLKAFCKLQTKWVVLSIIISNIQKHVQAIFWGNRSLGYLMRAWRPIFQRPSRTDFLPWQEVGPEDLQDTFQLKEPRPSLRTCSLRATTYCLGPYFVTRALYAMIYVIPETTLRVQVALSSGWREAETPRCSSKGVNQDQELGPHRHSLAQPHQSLLKHHT